MFDDACCSDDARSCEGLASFAIEQTRHCVAHFSMQSCMAASGALRKKAPKRESSTYCEWIASPQEASRHIQEDRRRFSILRYSGRAQSPKIALHPDQLGLLNCIKRTNARLRGLREIHDPEDSAVSQKRRASARMQGLGRRDESEGLPSTAWRNAWAGVPEALARTRW